MASPLSGKRLLLVAEDADLAALVLGAFTRLGATVQLASTGRAALDALARRAPDAAVLDFPLPDLPGSDVLAALVRSRVPAVAVSGVYRGARAAAELRRLGAMQLFEKPFAIDELARAVSRALGAPEAQVEEEARDEVTGARPLVDASASPPPVAGRSPAPPDASASPPPVAGRSPAPPAEELPYGIAAASPLPALMEGPVPAGRAVPDGFSTPLPDPDEGRRRPAAADGAPPASGELARTSVPRLLVALHLGQASGALTVTRGPVKKIVVVEHGVPVYAASNVGAERFGAICVRRGVVTAERLEALRREQPAARTAALLFEAGLLDVEKRTELLAGQIRAIAWSTFEWREGSYEFQLGKPPASRTPVRIAMGELVLGGMVRASTLGRLRADLPADVHLAPSPDPAFELYALGLRAPQARVLALADGTKSVADLVQLSDLPERDALAFLQACRVMRVLDEAERVLASTRRIGFM